MLRSASAVLVRRSAAAARKSADVLRCSCNSDWQFLLASAGPSLEAVQQLVPEFSSFAASQTANEQQQQPFATTAAEFTAAAEDTPVEQQAESATAEEGDPVEQEEEYATAEEVEPVLEQNNRKPLPWHADPHTTAAEGLAAIEQLLAENHLPSEKHLQQLALRIQTKEDVQLCVKGIEMIRKIRNLHGQTRPFSRGLSNKLLAAVKRVGDPTSVLDMVNRRNELGLDFWSMTHFHGLFMFLASNGEFDEMLRMMRLLADAGLKPVTSTTHIVIRACIYGGRPDLAQHFAEEYMANNIRMTPATVELLEGGYTRMLELSRRKLEMVQQEVHKYEQLLAQHRQ